MEPQSSKKKKRRREEIFPKATEKPLTPKPFHHLKKKGKNALQKGKETTALCKGKKKRRADKKRKESGVGEKKPWR